MKLKDIKTGWTSLTVSIRGVERQSHDLLVASSAHAFNNRLDFSGIKFGLDCLEHVSGSFRIQAVIAYLEEFAGVTIEADKDNGFGFKVTKNASWTGTRGKRQLEVIKRTKWFEWAPSEKPLNTPKISAQYWVTMARGYASGTITQADIESDSGDFGWSKVMTMIDSSDGDAILDWAEKYQRQA